MWRNFPSKIGDFFQKKENITTEYSFSNKKISFWRNFVAKKKKKAVPIWWAYMGSISFIIIIFFGNNICCQETFFLMGDVYIPQSSNVGSLCIFQVVVVGIKFKQVC
jgi:cellulose synthase/poly-beta-1,6-N-acetylglucosamine synthase-like glycosyltransferase